MFVQLGQSGQPDFAEPIALMKDCHRRIEHFLQVLVKVTDKYGQHELDDEGRIALEAAMDYFRHAAPRHIADEEESLFPRLRQSGDQQLRDALDELGRLEDDHRKVEAAHHRVDQLGRYWLDVRTLDLASLEEMSRLLRELADSYAEHIRLEDQRVYALAQAALDADAIEQIGREMQRRRTDLSERPIARPPESDPPVLVQCEIGPFVEAVATTPSVPASGCVSAVVAALAAALTEMVVSLSQPEAQDVKVELERLRHLLLKGIDRDADAFRAFRAARRNGQSMDVAIASGINDVPTEVAEHCLAAIECLTGRIASIKPSLRAEAYAASALALAAIDVSRFNLLANAQFMKHADVQRVYERVVEIHDEAVWHHHQIAATLEDTRARHCKA